MKTARLMWIVCLSLQLTFFVVPFGYGRCKLLQVYTKSNLSKNDVVKSIRSEDGDIIDCIDIYEQPAFDHPALKNHTFQTTPTYSQTEDIIIGEETKTWKEREEYKKSIITSQVWQRKGITCPNGTIPIRRVPTKRSFDGHCYGRKKPSYRAMQLDGIQNLMQENHSVAILLTQGYSYSGAKGDIGVWNPYVETDDEYSTSQVSLRNGPRFEYEEMEAGWAVNPSVYGDHQTRLFTYWTADASKTTGCFDHTCPGFVQTNNEIALGAAIYPISKPNGLPYKITIYIFKDPLTNNWWLQYGNEGKNIGYWPAELFKTLQYQAVVVQWGGEVYSSRVGKQPHTSTAMGSGHFSDPYHYQSGYIQRIRIQENGHQLKFPEYVYPYSEEYRCYDQYYMSDYVYDPEFMYGGPGRNPMCP